MVGVELTTIAGIGAFLTPIYVLLFSMNSKMGTVKEKTERNEQEIHRIREVITK